MYMPVRQLSLNVLLTIFDTACILILGGCGSLMDGEETVIVQFPSFPYSWMEREDSDFYELVYIDGGKERWISTVPGERKVAIRLSLGRTTPLLGYPVLYREDSSPPQQRETLRLYPAGGLYPDAIQAGVVSLSWEDGFAAAVLQQAEKAGFPLDSFNCTRFFQEAGRRGAPNPWNLDATKVIETLSEGCFRADRLTVRKKFTLSLPAISGIWYPENLLENLLTPEEDGNLTLTDVSWGLHRYYSQGCRLIVQVSETGKVLVSVSSDPYTFSK